MSDRTAGDIDLAVIAGDGIGPEVVTEGLKVLEAVTAGSGTKVSSTAYDLGATRWNATGETLPDSVLEELRGQDVILLGAIGDPSVPSGVLERGVLLTVLSRLGSGSRVVLTHDVAQRDNLRVGRHDGIAAVVEQLKGHPLFAHVTLTRSERSPIAALVTEMLEDLPL